MASRPELGRSELHTDCHHRGRLLLDRFRQPPPPKIAVPSITAEAAAACATTAQAICARETPVVVRGCTDVFRTTRWSSAEKLVEHYGDVPFELAADVTLSLRDYVRYAAEAEADYPYYLVERRFEGERAALLQDYAPPTLFDDDLLSQVPGSKRARYWLVGGERSGTALHADPLCTSAWNACACGRKLWAFLPPGADLAAVGLRTRAQGGGASRASNPRLARLPLLSGSARRKDGGRLACDPSCQEAPSVQYKRRNPTGVQKGPPADEQTAEPVLALATHTCEPRLAQSAGPPSGLPTSSRRPRRCPATSCVFRRRATG